MNYMDALNVLPVLRKKPSAYANITGGDDYPDIEGVAQFFQMSAGVMVYTRVNGLPAPGVACADPIFAYHIHSGGSCEFGTGEPFAKTLGHYNPNDCEHPFHAGDMPPLFGSGGYALSVFLSNRFDVSEIIGKTVVIHENIDDFMSQPSGNSGKKIACGVIQAG